jgi:mRNA-degrading endonuclease RelE of RelBE toxin-antitoxin system
MRDYELELSPVARRDLKKLPLKVPKAIVFGHLPQIQEAPYVKGLPLAEALKGERVYHFGRHPDYRIVYFIEEKEIVVTIIGTREGIYKRAKRG